MSYNLDDLIRELRAISDPPEFRRVQEDPDQVGYWMGERPVKPDPPLLEPIDSLAICDAIWQASGGFDESW